MSDINLTEIWIKPTWDEERVKSLSFFYDNFEKAPMLLRDLLSSCSNLVIETRPTIVKDDFFHLGYFPVGIVVHSAQDMLMGQASNSNGVYNFAQELHEDHYSIRYPLVHLTLSDLYVHSFWGTERLPKPVPRSYMIMDNSIWNYLVPITGSYYIKSLSLHYKSRNGKTFNEWLETLENQRIEAAKGGVSNYLFQSVETCMTKALISICNNYKKQLYCLKVAREFADLNARLTQQSYLSGAHAAGVAPFIFHSESCTKNLIKREFRSDKEGNLPSINSKYCEGSQIERLVKDRKWRILLIDDKAVEAMEAVDFCDYNNTEILKKDNRNCKLSIIQNILEYQLDLKGKVECRPWDCQGNPNRIPDETVILIEYAQSFEDAKLALESKKYDLILLDYLLNQSNGIHYGFELLEEIWTDQQLNINDEKKLKYNVSPHRSQRLYCMFISAYSSAVHDRLLAEGLNQSEDYWFISLGACPTNTPQLFLYNLLKLMDKRIEDSYINKLSVNGIIESLSKIFSLDGFVRKNAGEYYQEIQSYQYFYRSILKDYKVLAENESIFDTKGSVLMTEFMNNSINMGGLLEHMAQLVYITAFGTIRQWREMWEEYIYIKTLLSSQYKGGNQTYVQKLCKNIEHYIMLLKESAV